MKVTKVNALVGIISISLALVSLSQATESYSIIDLHTVGGNGSTVGNSTAYAINDSGQVTGWRHPASGFSFEAFLYKDNTMHDLGTFGGLAGSYSSGNAINESGRVAG